MANFGMGGYVGTGEDQRRIERQLKEREESHRQYEEAKKKAAAGAGLRQFGVASSEAVEAAFKNETVGLVTREQFVEKRATIEDRLKEEDKRLRHAAEEDAMREKDKQRAKKAKTEQKHKLSFDDDFGDDDDDEEAAAATAAAKPSTSGGANGDALAAAAADGGGGGAAGRGRYSRLGKDPSVRTDFLPDKDRQRAEEELREKLKAEYALRTAAIKAEPLEIIYSYYNGTGHRRAVTVRKGDTVGQFLKAVVEQLTPQFREIRTTSAGSLMYVKEDVILPQNTTFYELIVNKAMGKSGPLFQFDLHEHAAASFDPRMKSQDSHAGKVVDRHWYNKNKHIYPASRWAPFDEAVHLYGQKKEPDATGSGGGGVK